MVAQAGILDRVFHTLAKSPSPQEVMAICTTEAEDKRLLVLAEKSEKDGLTQDEQFEFMQFKMAEKYVRLAKAHAFAKMKGLAV